MLTAATNFFCKTHTTKLTDGKESIVVLCDGAEMDVATVVAEFVHDAGSPFMRAPNRRPTTAPPSWSGSSGGSTPGGNPTLSQLLYAARLGTDLTESEVPDMFSNGPPRNRNMMIKLPRCRHCNLVWKPRLSVVADKAYCSRCRKERRQIAKRVFGLHPLTVEDLQGPYLRPQKFRKARLRQS